MAVRVAINGFGRMGRLALRAAFDRPDFEIVHINETKGGAAAAAHLLEFDSVHGRWRRDISAQGDAIVIDGKRIGFSEYADPSKAPWKDLGIDIAVECSGKFKTAEALAPYFAAGVKKVIVAAPVKSGALNIVMGCNDGLYDAAKHHLVTAASCTTNCLAPVVKVIHEALTIERGAITTMHNVTNTQVVVDLPHKDLRRARSSLMSLIPTTTGSATAIAMIYPELAGKLNGTAVRVPLLNSSLTDCVFNVKKKTTAAEVNGLLKAASEGPLRGILGFEERPLVSVDFKDDPRSAIVDADQTMVVDDTLVKVFAWYDNEWGYVNRMMELTKKVAASIDPSHRGVDLSRP